MRKHSGDPVGSDGIGAGITDHNKYGKAWVAVDTGEWRSIAGNKLAQDDHGNRTG